MIHTMSDVTERLQKVLSSYGFGSRRRAEELIINNRVKVNGELAQLGCKVDVNNDLVEVDDTPLGISPKLVWYILNKPKGVISSARDPFGRPCVVDIVPVYPRVFPVGRLDADSEGLLILTNDGQLAFRLTHPSFGIPKEYLVQVDGILDNSTVSHLRSGVELEDGLIIPNRVSLLADNLLGIEVSVGRNRLVRRMCEAVGHSVVRLQRTRIGTVCDSELKTGHYRKLRPSEVRELMVSAKMIEAVSAAHGSRPEKDAGDVKKADKMTHPKG